MELSTSDRLTVLSALNAGIEKETAAIGTLHRAPAARADIVQALREREKLLHSYQSLRTALIHAK